MKNRLFTVLALAGSLILAPYAFAAQETGQKQQDQKAYGQQQKDTSGQQDQTLQKKETTTPQQQQVQSGQQQYSQQLLTAENLKGMQIKDQQGQELGSVDQIIVDTREGRLAYVVVSTGGLWGIGGETAVVPWTALQLQGETAQEGRQPGDHLVLNIQKDQLKNAPEGDLENVLDRQQAMEIHRFYGVSPYWESGQQDSQQQMRDQNLPPGHQPKEMRGQGEPPGHLPKEESR